MIFTEVRFFLFFIVVFATYWLLNVNKYRKIFLLAASYFFYAAWNYKFLSLILLSSIVDYVIGNKLAKTSGTERRLWLLVSLTVNLGMLAVFKYFNFFIESMNSLLLTIGLSDQISTLKIILPVGISFYTFQTLSYSIDIYRGKLEPAKNLLDFSLFVGFFPQLVAGPIVRASDFLGQLGAIREFRTTDVRWCLILFLCGFFKKACISDNISPYVDAFYQNPSNYELTSAACSVFLYSVQIYCDFSGYSDMAIASAGLLGYRLRENFEFPYLASNITDFWRRWHMSLSSWLRDYLYIPLGGNRSGEFKANRNLIITMLLGGLWHGASWNFVLWGALHGFALIVHKLFRRQRKETAAISTSNSVWPLLCWIFTFVFVSLTWIPFRCQSFSDTVSIFYSFACFSSSGNMSISDSTWMLWTLLITLLAAHALSRLGWTATWWRNVPSFVFFTNYGIAWAIVLSLRSMENTPFIYFQF